MWLELDKNSGMVLGVHSSECNSPNQWIEWKQEMGMPPDPGDFYKNSVITKAADMLPEADKRRREAASRINREYPTWKQMNILREGDPIKIAEMSKFIDDIRAWSNAV